MLGVQLQYVQVPIALFCANSQFQITCIRNLEFSYNGKFVDVYDLVLHPCKNLINRGNPPGIPKLN